MKNKQKSIEAYSKLLDIISKANEGWTLNINDRMWYVQISFYDKWILTYSSCTHISSTSLLLVFKSLELCIKSIDEDSQLWKDYFGID